MLPLLEKFGKSSLNPGQWIDLNPTLKAIVDLCSSNTSGKGVDRIVTYNYDNLLEIALGFDKVQSLWKADLLEAGKLPIYHVHGYIPAPVPISPEEAPADKMSKAQEIIFTEEQYHRATHDIYSWSNLTQLSSLNNYTVLMVGISLSDRNMRRILNVISRNKSNIGEVYWLTVNKSYVLDGVRNKRNRNEKQENILKGFQTQIRNQLISLTFK